MKINSRHFGQLDIEDDKIINFPKGIIGFPDARQFCILRLPDIEPYEWLQSIDQPELAFIAVPVLMLKPDYKLSMTKADYHSLGFEKEEMPLLLGIVVVPDDPNKASVNLLAPVAINEEKKIAGQVVNECRDYKTRHIIKDEMNTQAREGKEHVGANKEKESVAKAG